MKVALVDGTTSTQYVKSLKTLALNKWSEATVQFELPSKEGADPIMADDVRFLVGKGSDLYIDDVLIFEPAAGDGQN